MQSRINPMQAFLLRLLSQPKFTWAVILPLSCFDMTAWLALSLICLLILRQGVKAHWNLMCAAFVVRGTFLYFMKPDLMAWLSATNDFLPAELGAIALLYTRSWLCAGYSMLAGMFLVACGVDILMPDFVNQELKMLITSANQMISQLNFNKNIMDTIVHQHFALFAHLMRGLDILSIIFNAVISLTMARSLQAQLFNPGGFLEEMLSLRGSRSLFATLLCAAFLVLNLDWFLPLYVIPTLLFYFYSVGLSIGVCVLSKERKQIVFIILVASSILLPYIFLPIYVVMGMLDSFIDFRTLLVKQIKYRF